MARHAPRPTEEKIEQGLVALAIYNGDAKGACAALAEEGIEVDPAALSRWKNLRTKRYYELRSARLQVVRDRMGEAAGRLADRRAEMLTKVLDRIEDKLMELEPKDLVGLMRALDQGHSSNIVALEKLADQPTIVEHRNYDLTVERLQRLGVLEVEAEDVEEIPEVTPV